MPMPSPYSLSHYGQMVTDARRVQPYADALRRAITPDSVVIDLGAGPGFFSLLACHFGARKVYAVEPNQSVNLLHRLAADNGYSGRIDILNDFSTNIALPEQADVMISDLRGVLPIASGHIQAIIDARRRLLKPDAQLISKQDRLFTAVVSVPKFYESLGTPWLQPGYDLNMSAGLDIVLNQHHTLHLKTKNIITAPAQWATLDYTTIEHAHANGTAQWTVDKKQVGHGVAVWFEANLDDTHTFTSAPETGAISYGQMFFPWKEPVALQNGDHVHLTLKALDQPSGYIWQWRTEISSAAGQSKAAFNQSNFIAESSLQQRKS